MRYFRTKECFLAAPYYNKWIIFKKNISGGVRWPVRAPFVVLAKNHTRNTAESFSWKECNYEILACRTCVFVAHSPICQLEIQRQQILKININYHVRFATNFLWILSGRSVAVGRTWYVLNEQLFTSDSLVFFLFFRLAMKTKFIVIFSQQFSPWESRFITCDASGRSFRFTPSTLYAALSLSRRLKRSLNVH